MPISPFQRVQKGDGRSSAGRKRKSKPTTPAKNRKKKIKKRYSSAREEAQLAGVIPTTPDGAVDPEQVPPSAQGSQPLSEMVAQAIRSGWATPDKVKPELIDEMVKITLDPDMSAKAKISAFNALRMADQSQWERENQKVDKDQTGPFTMNINVVSVDAPQQHQHQDEPQMIEVEVVDDDSKQDDKGNAEAAEVPAEY